MTSLTDDLIAELLAPQQALQVVPQEGPLRFFDVEMRCANRGCSSPTYCKVQGVPRCFVHALHVLNEMLVAKGVMT